ncbi:TPA_asm: attP region and P4int integrase [Salmonella enterica subsp. enterica serovar Typhi str. CT18]|nr:attP region and P4int integrase [Salmonella enterica subsp. enterica serovar Typhi]HAD6037332.1 attP region and P4int integrase [Salmonella enterica subsp. enterica serovar Typhi str. CT18]
MTNVKSRLFTLHQLITTYHHDIKKKSEEVNSVNSYMEKRILLMFNITPVRIRISEPNRWGK